MPGSENSVPVQRSPAHSAARRARDVQTASGLPAEVLAELRPTADNALPKVRQLYLALYRLIERGDLAYDTRLPASRVLAQQLGLGRNTVIQVFEQLVAEGLLTSNGRNGTRVIRQVIPKPAKPQVKRPLSQRSKQLRGQGSSYIELAPGEPDSALFPHELWRKAASKAGQAIQRCIGLSSTSPAINPRSHRAVSSKLSFFAG